MKTELTERVHLSVADRLAMFGVLRRHFEGVEREVFEADLADKHYAILLRDEANVVQGFTTFAIQPVESGDGALWVVYSGDTIVDRAHWGSSALASAWIGAVRSLRTALAIERLAWLLICSGPRTYRFLPVFFDAFYPRAGVPTPFPIQVRMDRLASARYGTQYDASTGIVTLAHPQPLRAEIRDERGLPRDEHVAFFFTKNPGHVRGDELVCYTELDDDNLTSAGARMLRLAQARGLSQPRTKRVVSASGRL